MPQYLVRLAQAHESFRKVELQALADIAGVPLQFVKYEEDVSLICLSVSESPASTLSVASLHCCLGSHPEKRNSVSRHAVQKHAFLTIKVSLLHCRSAVRRCGTKSHRAEHLSTGHLRAMGSGINIRRPSRLRPQPDHVLVAPVHYRIFPFYRRGLSR
jgi:tRNA G10  N-methylase Trm11